VAKRSDILVQFIEKPQVAPVIAEAKEKLVAKDEGPND
jgi:hypothetical protein